MAGATLAAPALTSAEVAAGVEMVMGLVAAVQGVGDREAAGYAIEIKDLLGQTMNDMAHVLKMHTSFSSSHNSDALTLAQAMVVAG